MSDQNFRIEKKVLEDGTEVAEVIMEAGKVVAEPEKEIKKPSPKEEKVNE